MSPEQLEALFMPPHHGVGFDNDQSLLPITPEPREQDPKETVSWAKLRPLARAFHDGQLLAKREVLQSEIEGLFESARVLEDIGSRWLSCKKITVKNLCHRTGS